MPERLSEQEREDWEQSRRAEGWEEYFNYEDVRPHLRTIAALRTELAEKDAEIERLKKVPLRWEYYQDGKLKARFADDGDAFDHWIHPDCGIGEHQILDRSALAEIGEVGGE